MRVIAAALIIALIAGIAGAGLYFAAPHKLVDLALLAQRSAVNLKTEQVTIPGFTINYVDSHGTGEPLLLVHGFGGTLDNWLAIAPELEPHYRLIVPELPGFGSSSSPIDASYTIEEQAERLKAFVSAIGLKRVHVGGNSMGGAVAAAYAAAYPNEVVSLWLVANAGVRGAPRTPLMQRLMEGELSVLAPSTVEAYHALLDKVTEASPPIPALFKQVYAERAVASHALRRRQLEQLSREQWAVEDHLSGLPIPTHIVWGEEDQILHVGAVDILVQMLPKASQTIMPGIGHVPMLEAPVATAADYLAFRSRIGS